MSIEKLELANELINFIDNSPTMYNSIVESERILLSEGFIRLNPKESWKLEKGKKYYVIYGDSSLYAFHIRGDKVEEHGFRIICSHCDSPSFRIKNNPCVDVNNQTKLNVEPYGGMIISTWFDRPLSIAGRVVLENQENIMEPIVKVIKIDKPILIIPNLAIHMNRSINEGYSYNKQNDVMPIVLSDEKLSNNKLLDIILKYVNEDGKNFKINQILDFDLFLFEHERGIIVGEDNSYISSSRLDNLASVHGSLKALVESSKLENLSDKNKFRGINIISIFNNEEVGSLSKEGADSTQFSLLLERICISLGKNREEMIRSLSSSFMISADLAHAIHPNKESESDPTNKVLFGNGPAIKVHAGKAYASDSYSTAIYKELCNKNNIKYQYFFNRSDKRSGSTIGSIFSAYVPISIVDVGIPLLAMHSIRELANVSDYFHYYKSFYNFFNF